VAVDYFTGDPSTGSGTGTYLDGSEVEQSLKEFTGGRYYISGGAFIDTQDLMNPISIGQQGPFTMYRYPNGRYNLISETQLGNVNRPVGGEILRTVSGSVDVLSVSGELATLTINPVAVTHVGYQWIAYPQADGETGYTSVRGIYSTNAEVEQAFGAGFRLASPTESVYASLMKQLITDNADDIQRIIQENDIQSSQDHTAESLAVRFIMQIGNFANIHSFSSYLVE
jgi:hypothetical protein